MVDCEEQLFVSMYVCVCTSAKNKRSSSWKRKRENHERQANWLGHGKFNNQMTALLLIYVVSFLPQIDNEALHLIYGNFVVLLNDLNWFCTHRNSHTLTSINNGKVIYAWLNKLILSHRERLSKKVISRMRNFHCCEHLENFSMNRNFFQQIDCE